MKKIKALAAILALVFVVGSAFAPTASEQFGFISKTATGTPNEYDFVLVDLDLITSSSCPSANPQDFCKATVDLADPDVIESRSGEYVLFRATEAASGITYQESSKQFNWVP